MVTLSLTHKGSFSTVLPRKSKFLSIDFAENDDEFAAVLASEIVHVLANHTEPVKFTLPSRHLFSAAEIATSIGVMFLSKGIVTIGGQGWMEYIYTEAADLDLLDREYTKEEEYDALAITYLLLDRPKYASQALLTFWRRVQEDSTAKKRKIRLNRSISLQNRIAFLEELLPESQ